MNPKSMRTLAWVAGMLLLVAAMIPARVATVAPIASRGTSSSATQEVGEEAVTARRIAPPASAPTTR